MSSTDKWLLPEGIEEVLPPEAWQFECARRELLDLFSRWGYALIMPPFIEYLESLLTGSGNDLDLQTFKVTDQLSGRMMGLRADMTPQAARIDAHPLRRDEPSRLCYMGTVLQTRSDGFGGSRSPLQVGAELFGHAGIESDVEILSLVLAALGLMEIREVHVNLGHVGIFRGLARDAGLSATQESDLFDALQRKAVSDIGDMLDATVSDAGQRRRLAALAGLNGGPEVLEQALELLDGAGEEVMLALDNLRAIAGRLQQRAGDVQLDFDLAELRGYRYQTGMVFAVFVPGSGREIARGGRYDAIGEVFGRARPATGFSTDLRTLMDLSERDFDSRQGAVFAPADDDPALQQTVADLRKQGECVICALPGQSGTAADMGCDRVLVQDAGNWAVKPI
jgi:ATP phosphoribosyltransferase regulatory subunit